MSRRPSTASSRAPVLEPEPDSDGPGPDLDDVADQDVAARRDLSDLPVLGLTRRRAGYLLGVLLACWVLIVFARQVSEAAAASDQADALRTGNEQLAADVAGLERELQLIRKQEFIALEARRYRLGKGREIPFQIAPDAPPLEADAPGSASVKLGAIPAASSPLEAWLDVLFGPTT